ncbi:hypothetical protein SDJN02_19776, partial [Cucurbita argyrosperma subsp. argyrosperma]
MAARRGGRRLGITVIKSKSRGFSAKTFTKSQTIFCLLNSDQVFSLSNFVVLGLRFLAQGLGIFLVSFFSADSFNRYEGKGFLGVKLFPDLLHFVFIANDLMESKGGKKKSSSSSSKSLFYEAPLGYSIEDVRPHGGIKKFRSAAYSNCVRKPS